jgi:Na+-driven multidrug efflux pump
VIFIILFIINILYKMKDLYEREDFNTLKEVTSIFSLASGMFVSRVAYTAMKVTDSALLGHVSKDALSAAALSDLWTDSTGVFLQGRVLSTFVGNAIGSDNHMMAGVYLQIAFFVAGILLIPVLILWSLTGPVLRKLGNGEDISADA